MVNMLYKFNMMKKKEVKSMNQFKILFMVVVILCLVSPFSFAEDLTKDGPCQEDIQKFCKSVRPGNGKLLRCMRQYKRHLSTACVDHIGVVREKTRLFEKACKKDAQQFCADVKPGQGAVYRCLQKNQDSLSAVCANQIK